MTLRDLAPWKWSRKTPSPVEGQMNPLSMLQRQMNSLMEDFMSGFGFQPLGSKGFTPRINVAEDRENIFVAAELPGLSQDDVEVTLTREALTIRGEKKEEYEEKDGKSSHYAERSYGYFERVIPLNCEVNEDRVDAEFKNGVLKIKLGKSAAAQEKSKKIPIK